MGTWGTAIKDSDAFADIYSEFFDNYNKGDLPENISKKIIADNWEILEIPEERHSLWFALALAQWETKSLEIKVLSIIENIISSGDDLKLWLNLGVSQQDIKKRKVVLNKFLEKLKSDRLKAKPRKKEKLKTPIFSTGDCLIFKMINGNYGGAIVLASDTNPEKAYNLVATTRLNQKTKPSLDDFENSEVLICNFGQWKGNVYVIWCMPDLYYKNFSDLYELIGKINVEFESSNYAGKGYLFKPFYTSGWNMKNAIEQQLESETTKTKPSETLAIKKLIKKEKWWNVF